MFSRLCQFSLLFSTTLFIISCSGSGSPSYNPDVGPFDEDGNYVEAWADNPPKRGSNLRNTEPKPVKKSIAKKAPPKVVAPPAPVPIPAPRPAPRPVLVARSIPVPAAVPQPVLLPQPIAPAPVVKKPVVSRPTVTAPRVTRHVVTRGDTLYGLSKRYGKSVSAIQRANGISGSKIITGRSYIIPQ